MLGYIISTGRGAGDLLLADVAAALVARGVAVAGAVQMNIVHDPDRPCHMDLKVLGADEVLRISQDLGRHATGCRLDPAGLADAVARVESALDRGGAALVIVNKFGKQEIEGGGFRNVIGRALTEGVPVLTSVSERQVAQFLGFAGDLAVEVPADPDGAVAWCLTAQAARSAA